MCGILGIAKLKNADNKYNPILKTILRSLFKVTAARGWDATGAAFVTSSRIDIVKNNVDATKFIDSPNYINMVEEYFKYKDSRLRMVVGHCRMKTQGTEIDNLNNHPIVCDNIVGVHNGIIHNDNVLFNTYKDIIKRAGKVDSEIIFRLIDKYSCKDNIHKAIQIASSEINGSMACAMVSKKFPYALWLFRRDNPCTVIVFNKIGVVMWASDINHLTNIVDKYKIFNEREIIEFPINSGIAIDTIRNKMFRFSINTFTNKKGRQHG